MKNFKKAQDQLPTSFEQQKNISSLNSLINFIDPSQIKTIDFVQ